MIGNKAVSPVLGILAPGGLLTSRQITAQAHITSWAGRRALAQLEARGLVMPVAHSGRWAITQRGRAVTLVGSGR